MTMDIEKLRAQRADFVTKARAIVDAADEAQRELDTDERRNWEDYIAHADQLAARIEREEKMREHEEERNRSHNEPTKPELGERQTAGAPTKFRSFGEQMLAVIKAGRPGEFVDPRLTLRASGLNETLPSDGGFLVQTDFSSELLKRTYATGQVANRCRRIPISGNANGLKMNAVSESSRATGSRWGGIRGYWQAEAGTKQASTPEFRQMELSLKKLTGLCYVTDELLQDSSALEAVLMQGFAEEFGFLLDESIINGTGAGQPQGILGSGALVTVAKEDGQAADTIVTENVIKMWSRMYAPSRQNAVWFINQDVEPQLYTMSIAVGTGGVPVYMPAGGLSGQPYGTLFGRPVIAIEQCDTVGDLGDIILADMSQYLLIDKGGMQSASSIHVRFIYDESVFRFVYRVDGQPMWQTTLTPYNSSLTLSPFVALAARA
jgi:HK97 family phage major capsid protein